MTLTQFLGDTETHTIPMRWRGRAFVPGTAWVLKFTVKALSSQTDALRLLQKGYPAFGVTVSGCNAVVTILREDTFRTAPPFEAAEGKYVWDIQAQQVAAPNHTRTVASGTFVLERDVTRLSDFTGPIYTTENPLTLVTGPAGATETTASILTKLAQGTGGAGDIGAEYLPDALSGAGVPTGSFIARETIRNWGATASSADGVKLVAVVQGGQIYTSADSGSTWTARDSVRSWQAVASSAEGTKLVAGTQNGQLYTSTDSGGTWTARESSRNWLDVASSADGVKLAAVAHLGQIHTSTDSGVTWTARDSARDWSAVSSSADGTKLVASVYAGLLYTSTDSGVTWTARESVRTWSSIASSTDGTKLVATVYNGRIYASSNSGVTWAARESVRNWYDVAISSDGTNLVAIETFGNIYTANDTGFTWTARESIRDWSSVAISADGAKIVATVNPGQIYTFAAASASYLGQPYRNTTTDEWYRWNGTAWQKDGSWISNINGGNDETTATVLDKIKGAVANPTKVGAEYLPDALSGAGVPASGMIVSGTLTSNGTDPVVFPLLKEAGVVLGRMTFTDDGSATNTLPTTFSYYAQYNNYLGGNGQWEIRRLGLPLALWRGPLNGGEALPSDVAVWTALGTATGSPTVTKSLVASYLGQPYRNTTANEWYRWNGTAWQKDVSSIAQFNIDGGTPSSVYGGIPNINGGTP